MPPADAETTHWFATHVQSHEAMLRAWLARSLGPRVIVDDVIQEAYIRVLQARSAGALQAPKAFLFAVARNIALDQLRRHAVSRTDSLVETDITNVLDDSESIPDRISRNQELAVLTEAVQSLPDRCRQIMTLRLVYGLTQRVIGEKLGLSDRTIATQLAIGTQKCSEFVLRRLEKRFPPR